MAITVIDGPPKSGKDRLARVFRDHAIATGHGCLLLGEETEGDPAALVEKIIKNEKLPEDVTKLVKADMVDGKPVKKERLDAISWKHDPLIIVVSNKGRELLKKIEERCPGFTERFGPATGVSTTLVEL